MSSEWTRRLGLWSRGHGVVVRVLEVAGALVAGLYYLDYLDLLPASARRRRPP